MGSPPEGRRLPRVGAMFLCAVLLLGCEPSPDQIERWKSTEKGPGKLADLLQEGGAKLELRAQAAAALFAIGRSGEVEEQLRHMPEAARRNLVHLTVPRLASVVRGGDPAPADSGAAVVRPAGASAARPPTRQESEAKDGLFRLRLLGGPEDQQLADQALLEFVTADLSGRMSAGSIGSEQILLALGKKAGGRLAAFLSGCARDATPEAPGLLPAASILGRLGDPVARQKGAESLIRLIDEQLARQGLLLGARRAEGPTSKRPTHLDTALRALGLLGGPVASGYLQKLASSSTSVPLRQLALAALGEAADPSAVAVALRLAKDRLEQKGVREAAFAYLERAGQIVVPDLLKIIADPGEPGPTGEIVRFRALEAALSAGQCSAIAGVLDALPEGGPGGRGYSKEDLTSYVVHQITPMGALCLPAVRDALHARSWVARTVGLLALSELANGHAQDEALVRALGQDGARLRGAGFFPANTVGDLAVSQAAALHRKRPTGE